MPGLDALEDVAHREYGDRERRADSLDTKAGLALGFAGLLVSLTPETLWPPMALLARLLGAAAAVLALAAAGVRTPDEREPLSLRGPLADARYASVRDLEQRCVLLSRAVVKKGWRVRASLRLLTAAVGSIALGAAVVVVGEWVR